MPQPKCPDASDDVAPTVGWPSCPVPSAVLTRGGNRSHPRRGDLPSFTPVTACDALQDMRHRALQEAKQQRYPQAIAILNRLLACHPHSAADYCNRGLVHFWSGQPQRALSDYNRALALNPSLAEAYNNRANYYAAQGAWESAIADYEQAIDLNPLNVRARINHGVTLRELHRYDAAIAVLDEALIFHRLMGYIYAERGRTYHLRGDWNVAVADYRDALQHLPTPPEPVAAYPLWMQVNQWLQQLQP